MARKKKKRTVSKPASAEPTKRFIWKYMRISFWAMIIIFIIFVLAGEKTIVNEPIEMLLSSVWIVAVIFCFVTSIIHLKEHKQKAFAVTALVFSSLLLLLAIFSLIVGILLGLAG